MMAAAAKMAGIDTHDAENGTVMPNWWKRLLTATRAALPRRLGDLDSQTLPVVRLVSQLLTV